MPKTSSSRILLTTALVLAFAADVATGQAVAPPPTMPLADVRVGMHGVGLTVVSGSQPEEFGVEVLGILHDVFPKHDLIVARLSGLGLERSGVVAGMSGSPVLVDGRVVGAVAYRLVNFGHEAIAGIVPIEQMLAIAELPADTAPAGAAMPGVVGEVLHAAAARLTDQPAGSLTGLAGVSAGAGIEPIATPMSLAGFQPDLVRRLVPLFEELGFAPVAGGVGGAGVGVDPNFVPGGAMAVQLIRGDVSVTASGTITYRDGDRLLAFGHPFLQGGSVDFPMVAGEVITVLSSSASSSKLSISGREVLGAIRQDRLAGIMGILGAEPKLVPVRLRLRGETGIEEQLRMEIVADKILTPLYLFLGIINGVQSLHRVYGEGSVELAARIRLVGESEEVQFGNLFSSPNQAVIGLSATLAGIFGSLYDNAFGPVQVGDVDIDVRLRSDRRSATIERIWYDRRDVRPGETLRVVVTMKPYRRPVVVEQFEVPIPANLAPGPVTLLIGAGDVMAQEEAGFVQGALRPRDLGQLVEQLNRARRSDHLYIQMSRPAAGALINGRLLPALPPSVLGMLGSEQSRGDVVPVRRAVVMESSQAVDYVVTGSHRIELNVQGR